MEADGFDDQSLGTAFPRQSLQVILCDEILVESPADDVVEFIVIQIDEISVFLVHGAVSLFLRLMFQAVSVLKTERTEKGYRKNQISPLFLKSSSSS